MTGKFDSYGTLPPFVQPELCDDVPEFTTDPLAAAVIDERPHVRTIMSENYDRALRAVEEMDGKEAAAALDRAILNLEATTGEIFRRAELYKAERDTLRRERDEMRADLRLALVALESPKFSRAGTIKFVRAVLAKTRVTP